MSNLNYSEQPSRKYLGKTREKEFFLSPGDVDTLTMTTLSFLNSRKPSVNVSYIMKLTCMGRQSMSPMMSSESIQVPWFATYKKNSGELDFYVKSRLDNKNYGLEVKRGREPAYTGNSLLENNKLDYLYNLKKTYGGIFENKYTVPIYLAGRVKFDLGL